MNLIYRISVPLRGYFFEILTVQGSDITPRLQIPSPYGDIFLKFCRLSRLIRAIIADDSVPLRGYFFEITFHESNIQIHDKRFRPLTGIFF